MKDKLALPVLYATLKKVAGMQYVSEVRKIDNTILVVNKDGTEDRFDMIKGEKGDKGDDYNHEVACEAMNKLIEEYKEQELSEVQMILGGVNGN